MRQFRNPYRVGIILSHLPRVVPAAPVQPWAAIYNALGVEKIIRPYGTSDPFAALTPR